MDFKKKLKTRLHIAVIYTALGIMITAGAIITKTDNVFLSSFGFPLAMIGIIRIRNYFMITKSEETIKKQEIAETDERNLAIMHKARSIAFITYIMISCAALIILLLFDMQYEARLISYSICLLLIIYWIAYFIVRKKS